MRICLLAVLLSLLFVADARADRVVLVAGGGDKPEARAAATRRSSTARSASISTPRAICSSSRSTAIASAASTRNGMLTRIAGTGVKGIGGDGGRPLARRIQCPA